MCLAQTPRPNLAFLCRNLDYKPYSITPRPDTSSWIAPLGRPGYNKVLLININHANSYVTLV